MTMNPTRRVGTYLNHDRRMKLTDAQIGEIRTRYWEGGALQQALADEFGVSQGAICLIIHNRSRRGAPRSRAIAVATETDAGHPTFASDPLP